MSKDCSQHKKEVAGISDMKALAEMIGDLHYESLAELLEHLSKKIEKDGDKDHLAGRKQLGVCLRQASIVIYSARNLMSKAWSISKPFMNTKH